MRKKATLLTGSIPTEYFIDIDPDSSAFSTAFKDFYKNHFVNAYGLARGEVDPYFFKAMTTEEIEEAHFEQVTDLKNEESIEMLLEYLNDHSGLVKSMALEKLNFILSGHYEEMPGFNIDYFLQKRYDSEFKLKLLENLRNLCE